VKYEFICPKCQRHLLLFWRPANEPSCRHGRRWRLFGARMQQI
jgi:hypothetical protein